MSAGPHRYNQESAQRFINVRVMLWVSEAEMCRIQIRAMPVAMKSIGAPPAILCNAIQGYRSMHARQEYCQQKPYRLPVILANQGGHKSYQYTKHFGDCWTTICEFRPTQVQPTNQDLFNSDMSQRNHQTVRRLDPLRTNTWTVRQRFRQVMSI